MRTNAGHSRRLVRPATAARARVRLPLFGVTAGPCVKPSNATLERVLAEADAAHAVVPPTRRARARRR